MQFANIVAFFAAGALAAPAVQVARDVVTETLDITNFSIRKNQDNTLANLYFNINGGDAKALTCTLDNPVLPYSAITKCGDTNYSFALVNGVETEFAVRIYKALGGPAGLYGDTDVFAYCRAGGQNDQICSQQSPISVVIDNV